MCFIGSFARCCSYLGCTSRQYPCFDFLHRSFKLWLLPQLQEVYQYCFCYHLVASLYHTVSFLYNIFFFFFYLNAFNRLTNQTKEWNLLHVAAMPSWLKWGFWVSPLSYGEIGLAVNEFLSPRWNKVN